MFLFIVNGLDVEIRCGTLYIMDIKFINSLDFGVGGWCEWNLIVVLVGELFLANVSRSLLFGGEMQARKLLSIELIEISDSAPLSKV